ncbi:phospholipid-transporting ATPase ABCA1-like isoform X2 [Drosophila eugracilis]|uniref:phospholipid-transporting ATPase ABCA1-like isoform X2 n=1 Tax=Drosophila eugracilis TaxID=29029 RepID=UPI001BDAADDD|nr:phospholipid-transporting ATPase ABCA1-like isoform X2 [Drosophila eugracilis]
MSNWDKFVLLLWKNWIIQWGHKKLIFGELLLPFLFTGLLILIRDKVPIKHLNITNYTENYPSNSRLFLMSLSDDRLSDLPVYYSPKNDLLDKLVLEAMKNLPFEKYYASKNAAQLEGDVINKNAFAGIQFDDSWSNLTDHIPDDFHFTLRFPSKLRLAYELEQNTWLTSQLFPTFNLRGQQNHKTPGYYREGFLALQQEISMAYIRQKSLRNSLPDVTIQHYPYPEYKKDDIFAACTFIAPFFIIMCFFYSFINIIKFIAAEKEKQLKEVMKIMGLRNWLHWAAWFVKAFIPLSILATIITICLKINMSNGPLLATSSFTAVLFFLITYLIAGICFSFMMAVLFSRASTASTVTSVIFILSHVPYYFTFGNISLSSKLGWSLIPNTAIGYGFNLIINFEETGDGFQWSYIFTPASDGDSLTVGAVMIMMMVSSVIFTLICLYIEQVSPGNFGVPRPWNFPFTREFWGIKSIEKDNFDLGNRIQLNPSAFESETEGKLIGLRIQNLRKRFANKTVVKDLTLNMYKDEITVLLGHNGAGKTTTVSMLTGMIPPTSGSAIINGYDITTNTEEARMSMGICPQHNVLFDEMTVSNHIRFFSQLKGLRGKEVEMEVAKYLKMIDLEDKENVPSSKLSGGMKRKLSVCCSLCGGTKVVLLDEPSSGMDPSARRHLWDILQKEKIGRTLLLTTHYMDEADVLGDRIAIMCDGNLECLGTPFFLKKQYGSGYKLICVKGKGCEVKKVTDLLNRFIPNLKPHSNVGVELTYQLPDSASPEFEEMFEQLNQNSGKLHLNGYGVNITSLEEVFMKIGAEKDSTGKVKDRSENGDTKYRSDDEYKSVESFGLLSENRQQLRGLQLVLNQWKAMLLKKLLSMWRNKLLLFVLNVIPVIFLLIGYLSGIKNDELKPMTFSITQYPSAVTVLDLSSVRNHSETYKIGRKYADLAKSYGDNYRLEETGKRRFEDYILDVGGKKQTGINSQYLVAATFFESRIIARLNNQAYHTAPLTINMVHNAMAKALVGPQVQIQVTNSPLQFHLSTDSNLLTKFKNVGVVAVALFLSMSFVSSMYILFPIVERGCRAKLLQYVGGVKVWTFWLSQFVCDFATNILTALIVVLTIVCFQLLDNFEELFSYFVLLLFYGFSALPLMYILSLFFKEPATGYSWSNTINYFLGIGMLLVNVVVKIINRDFGDNRGFEYWISRISPMYSLGAGFYKVSHFMYKKTLCDASQKHPDWESFQSTQLCSLNLYSWDGLLPELVCMIASGIFFFVILFLMEYRLILVARVKIQKMLYKKPFPSTNNRLDDDVTKERVLTVNMTQDEIASKNLVLDRVTKYYGRFLAVDQVSLCVKGSECFGLLGVNGAGKTTIFKMITGEELITSGTAHVQGQRMGWNMSNIYKMIGYCPQFDALPTGLTGREVLRIFCLLRGIQGESITRVSMDLAKSFGFINHIDKQTVTFSGGNKRKLSAAIAVIGNPSVIYLDEPTAGMDPMARRQLTKTMNRLRDSGKSIILTSHSMEECEAMCTRLAIMVNGEFQCLGSTQHLKNKFSKGLILKIKMRQNLVNADRRIQNIDVVRAFVSNNYPQSVLRENTSGLLTFYIPLDGVKWSNIFGMMERNRNQLNVEDYSVSQTTLEEIFLEFAKNQRE